MNLRQLALSIAVASAIGAAAPSFAQSDTATYPSASPPDSVSPYTLPSTPDSSTTVIVVPDSSVAPANPDLTYNSRTGLPNGTIITEPGGMTPQERRDTEGTADRTTGQITAPGYMGPRDSRGQ